MSYFIYSLIKKNVICDRNVNSVWAEKMQIQNENLFFFKFSNFAETAEKIHCCREQNFS